MTHQEKLQKAAEEWCKNYSCAEYESECVRLKAFLAGGAKMLELLAEKDGERGPRVWVSIPGATTWMEMPPKNTDGFPDAIEYVSIEEFNQVKYERDAFLEGDSEWEYEAKEAKKELVAARKDLTELVAARAEAAEEEESEFRWVKINDKDELYYFYVAILQKIRESAKPLGYAIGVHGSMRRDLDLIAAPWTTDAVDKDSIARAIQKAACGLVSQNYQWEEKPLGRMATCFPVCFPNFDTMRIESSFGHIDLSVMPSARESNL